MGIHDIVNFSIVKIFYRASESDRSFYANQCLAWESRCRGALLPAVGGWQEAKRGRDPSGAITIFGIFDRGDPLKRLNLHANLHKDFYDF